MFRGPRGGADRGPAPAATTRVRGTGTDVVAPFCWPRAARPAAPSATVCSGSFSRETGRPSSSASAAAIAPVRVLHPTSTTASRSPGRRRALARARCSPATAAPSVGCVSVGYGTASGRPAIVNAPPRCTRTVASTLPPPRSTTATPPPSRSPSRAAYRAAAASGSETRETAPSPRLTATPANASCSSSPQVAGWVSTIAVGGAALALGDEVDDAAQHGAEQGGGREGCAVEEQRCRVGDAGADLTRGAGRVRGGRPHGGVADQRRAGRPPVQDRRHRRAVLAEGDDADLPVPRDGGGGDRRAEVDAEVVGHGRLRVRGRGGAGRP